MPPAPELRPDLAEYRSLGVVSFPLGESEELVYSESSGAARVLPVADVDLLTGCDAFRTLDAHAREMCRRWNLPPDRMGSLLYQLALFARSKLLVSRSDLLERCRSRVDEGGRVTTVGLLTRDRPSAVEGVLAPVMESARDRVVLVLDGSDSLEARSATAALGRRFGRPVRYAGAGDLERYRAAIVREGGIDPQVVEFALGDAPGGRLNAFLLATVGGLSITLDDRGEGRLSRPPESDEKQLAVSSADDPTRVWTFPDREAARRAALPADDDFVGLHERWLGRDPSAIAALAEAEGGLDLDGMDARFLRLLWGAGGRVRLTQPGEGGLCLQSVARATLGNRPFFSAFGAGFDHREALPPFLPVTALDGASFAAALLKSSDRACIGHLPRVMFREASEESAPAAGIRFREVVAACMASFEPGRAVPEGGERLTAMGRHLEGMGAMPRPEFEEIVRKLHWFFTGRRIGQLEAQAREDEGLRKSLAELRKALPREEYLAPADLTANRTASEARDFSQRLILRFGRLLREWPALVEAARALGRKEQGLGSPA